MKKLLTPTLAAICLLIANDGNAQIWKKVKKAAQRGVERTTERRTERESEKTTDDVFDIVTGKKSRKKRKQKGSDNNPEQTGGGLEDNSSLEDNASLEESGANQVNFKRGGRIIFSDSFERDAIGDFPAKWSTSRGGEVKKLKGYDEKWLKVPAGSKVYMELTKPLPKNFTVEMDLLVPGNIPYRMVGIAFLANPEINLSSLLSPYKDQGVGIFLNSRNEESTYLYGNQFINLTWSKTEHTFPLNKRIKLAFEVNNHERYRAYADGKKIVDLPRTFRPEYANTLVLQAITNGAEESMQNQFYVSNVVIAETGTDERSEVSKELLENGTFTTNDILFASGSDNIQNSSSTILKEIGQAIKTVPSTQFLIIGHTDSDGEEDANQALSQQRAEAVRNYLIQNYGLASSQFMCVGKGESEPVADNNSSSGKAQNRRVEFKKL